MKISSFGWYLSVMTSGYSVIKLAADGSANEGGADTAQLSFP